MLTMGAKTSRRSTARYTTCYQVSSESTRTKRADPLLSATQFLDTAFVTPIHHVSPLTVQCTGGSAEGDEGNTSIFSVSEYPFNVL